MKRFQINATRNKGGGGKGTGMLLTNFFVKILIPSKTLFQCFFFFFPFSTLKSSVLIFKLAENLVSGKEFSFVIQLKFMLQLNFSISFKLGELNNFANYNFESGAQEKAYLHKFSALCMKQIVLAIGAYTNRIKLPFIGIDL